MMTTPRHLETPIYALAEDAHVRLSQECGERSDLFYRAITKWVALGGRDRALAHECKKLGSAYLESLDLLLRLPDYRFDRGSALDGLGLHRERALEYRRLLVHDLDILDDSLQRRRAA